MFVCMECRNRFRSTRAAERAADKGCPKCGSVDIDEDMPTDAEFRQFRKELNMEPISMERWLSE